MIERRRGAASCGRAGAILEPSSGNTGISLAMHRPPARLPGAHRDARSATPERAQLLRLYGAEIVSRPASSAPTARWPWRASCRPRTPRSSCRSSTATRPTPTPTTAAPPSEILGDCPRGRRLRRRPGHGRHPDGLRPPPARGRARRPGRGGRAARRRPGVAACARSRTATSRDPRPPAARPQAARHERRRARTACAPWPARRASSPASPPAACCTPPCACRRARRPGATSSWCFADGGWKYLSAGLWDGRRGRGRRAPWTAASGGEAPARARRRDGRARPVRAPERGLRPARRPRTARPRLPSGAQRRREPVPLHGRRGRCPAHRPGDRGRRRRRGGHLPLAHDVAGLSLAHRHRARDLARRRPTSSSRSRAIRPRSAPGACSRAGPPEELPLEIVLSAEHGLAEPLERDDAARRVTQAALERARSVRAERGSAALRPARRRRAPVAPAVAADTAHDRCRSARGRARRDVGRALATHDRRSLERLGERAAVGAHRPPDAQVRAAVPAHHDRPPRRAGPHPASAARSGAPALPAGSPASLEKAVPVVQPEGGHDVRRVAVCASLAGEEAPRPPARSSTGSAMARKREPRSSSSAAGASGERAERVQRGQPTLGYFERAISTEMTSRISDRDSREAANGARIAARRCGASSSSTIEERDRRAADEAADVCPDRDARDRERDRQVEQDHRSDAALHDADAAVAGDHRRRRP